MANIRKKVNKGGAVWPAGGRGNFSNFSNFSRRGHLENLRGGLPAAPCFFTALMALPTIPKKNRGTGKAITMQVPTILCILFDAG